MRREGLFLTREIVDHPRLVEEVKKLEGLDDEISSSKRQKTDKSETEDYLVYNIYENRPMFNKKIGIIRKVVLSLR